jgi:enoyl-[acyl-carrier-protein] reductase (NADH)
MRTAEIHRVTGETDVRVHLNLDGSSHGLIDLENCAKEEVGSTAAFLASPLASGITGQVIYADAGYCITGM